MPIEGTLIVGLAASLALAYAVTPVAIRVAHHFELFDLPVGYKGHARPTPYLGGAAVMLAFCTVALALAGHLGRTIPLLGGMVVLAVVGLIDDRRTVAWWIRLAIEAVLAAGLWALGLGWDLHLGSAIDFGVTVVWVAAVVNAINLFDNMDGAASTMAAVVAGMVTALGLIVSDVWLVATGAALTGACLGFLPHNLSSPAKIFLGDGGSMPIGFGLAALVMIGASDARPAWQALAIGVLLVGIPALDTSLVVLSRRRRGLSVLDGGRDHLTHRTRRWMADARAVAIALGAGQAVLGTMALVTVESTQGAVVAVVVLYVVAAGCVIVALDRRFAAPERLPNADASPPLGAVFVVLGLGGLVLGLSAFEFGGYDTKIWVPSGLVVMALLTALALAHPVRLRGPGLLAVTSLAALAVWADTSSLWSSSSQRAFVEGNRWALYAALLAVFLMLLSSRRLAVAALGAAIVGVLAVATWTMFHLLDGTASEVFLHGRLNEPLGYINGQAGVYALAVFPCLALAELRRTAVLAGIGAGTATLLGALVVLTQSRGVTLALVVAFAFLLVLVPGRLTRVALLVTVGGAIAALSGPLLAVYSASPDRAVPSRLGREAGLGVMAAAVLAGVVWGLLVRAQASGEPTVVARARRAATRIVVVAGAAAVVVAALPQSGVRDRLSSTYHQFATTAATPATDAPASRLLAGESNRRAYWDVAIDQWRDHPLAGDGAGSFGYAWERSRDTGEYVRQPHSLAFQTLGELGLIGVLLLGLLLGAVGWGVTAARRRAGTGSDRYLLVAGVGMTVTWLAHTTVDWMHLLPGVTGLALLGFAVLMSEREQPTSPSVRPSAPLPERPRRARAIVAVAVGSALVAGVVSLSRQGLSERFTREAQRSLASDPHAAVVSADRALELDPSSVPAALTKSAGLRDTGQLDAAQRVLEDAVRQEPANFLPLVSLGDLLVRRGRPGEALKAYSAAADRNPLEPLVSERITRTRRTLDGG
jgi:UDP-GlcNAc:undecaprenyl-phosphate GlcNAc-1-phosphate transferase